MGVEVSHQASEELLALLPHRAPFVLVDSVLEIEPGRRIVGAKRVRADEFWAPGHFPGNPIFPGVLLTEAIAQCAALIFLSTDPGRAGVAVYLVGLDKMRFRRMVRPGDDIRIEVVFVEERRRMYTFDATATVGEHRVATGSLLATVDTSGAPHQAPR